MTARIYDGDGASSGLETDICFKLGSERRDFSGVRFYGDGERNGDGDSVVETVKCYERELVTVIF